MENDCLVRYLAARTPRQKMTMMWSWLYSLTTPRRRLPCRSHYPALYDESFGWNRKRQLLKPLSGLQQPQPPRRPPPRLNARWTARNWQREECLWGMSH